MSQGITVEQLAEAIQLAVNQNQIMVGEHTLRIPGYVAGPSAAHLQLEVEHASGVVVQTFILDIEGDH